MDVPYVMKWGHYYKYPNEVLNPTGRWMIKSTPFYENRLFIEHKGLIFKKWVSEEDIEYRPARKAIINNCE